MTKEHNQHDSQCEASYDIGGIKNNVQHISMLISGLIGFLLMSNQLAILCFSASYFIILLYAIFKISPRLANPFKADKVILIKLLDIMRLPLGLGLAAIHQVYPTDPFDVHKIFISVALPIGLGIACAIVDHTNQPKGA